MVHFGLEQEKNDIFKAGCCLEDYLLSLSSPFL